MRRILLCSVIASAVCAMAVSNADAASRKHHSKGHYGAATAKLKTVASRRLVVSEPPQTVFGRSIAGDNSIDRYEIQKWGLLGP